MTSVEPGRVIAGKYRLLRRISGGGMGSVWMAHHGQLDAPVALKFMHGSLLDVHGARARFEREAKAAARIRSPFVVHVYDHGIDDDTGMPFIVMEYLEGEDLGRRLKRVRRLELADAVRICEQVCKGLYRAHKLGIVHRDLKPGNVFLSEPDDDMVKLLDFGIAKETGSRRVVKGETTTTGQVLGSPHYMSPEQARGQPLDGRSDLWSLAVILFRALTGKRPFDGEDIGDLIVRICTDPIPRASSIQPELGPVVDGFFDRAFARDPAARFQSAKALAAEFEAAIMGTPAAIADTQPISEVVPPSSSWDSKGSFSSSLGGIDVDDEAVTQMTPPLEDDSPTRTPVDASHTLAALGYKPRRKRHWAMLAAFLLAGAAAGTLAVGMGRREREPPSTAAPSTATPSTEAPSTEAAAAAPASAPVVSTDAPIDAPSSAASAAASASAPAPLRRPPRVAPRPPPPPAPKTGADPDLGY